MVDNTAKSEQDVTVGGGSLHRLARARRWRYKLGELKIKRAAGQGRARSWGPSSTFAGSTTPCSDNGPLPLDVLQSGRWWRGFEKFAVSRSRSR